LQITWLQALLVAVAAYTAMSTWTFGVGYFTLYRPLIGGTIVGLILGDVKQGMAFGAALNAVYLGFVSTGGTLPSDLVTAGYTGAALALASGLNVDAALATFGIPLGVLGGFLWFARMTFGSVFVHWADARAERGDTQGVAAINLWPGQGLLFLVYSVPTFVIVYYGQWGVDQVLALIPGRLADALAVIGGMLPAVGIGLLLRSLGKARLLPYFVVGFVLATYLDLPIVVIALLGGAVAWLVLGLHREGALDPDPSAGASRPIQGARTAFAGGEGASPTSIRVPRSVLRGAWWRWLLFLHASYNYERLQGLGFAHTLKPVIEHLYKSVEERAAALKRHLTFFNSEPQFGALVPAVVIAMEEERASGADIPDEAINGVKSGLMGPLAGVGDSLIQGVITPLLLSLGISLAQQGNLMGPILYTFLISGVIIGANYAFWSLGYRWGRAAVSRILASGWVKRVTDATSIVGLMVVGGLTATIVQFSTPASIVVGQMVVSLQGDVLDPVLRGLLPLSLALLLWWLLSRRVSPMQVIGLVFVAGIDLTYLGLAGQAAPPLFSAAWLSFLVGGQPATVGSALAYLSPPLLATALAFLVPLLRRRVSRGPGHSF
jgi:PTS system mannose-specific IID component